MTTSFITMLPFGEVRITCHNEGDTILIDSIILHGIDVLPAMEYAAKFDMTENDEIYNLCAKALGDLNRVSPCSY